MNREITFRGLKADGSSEWAYGDLVNCGGLKYIIPIDGPSSVKYLPKQDESYHTEIRAIAIKVIPETVGQFTGLNDTDLNNAFDGSIIENCDTKALQVVYWNEDKAAWYCRYLEDEKRIVSLSDSIGNLNKVIGNIHQR